MKFLLGIIVCIFGMTYLAEAQELTVLTTTWAPYSYEENGNITGLATKIVRAVLKKAEISADINHYPWKRAIITAGDEKNILIYPLIRTPERETNFVWVAPVFNAEICLFRLKKRKDIVLTSLGDAKKYTIGVLRGAAMHQHLLSRGFEDGKQLVVLGSNRKIAELLFRERIDLAADNPLVLSYETKQLGYPIHESEKVLQLFEDEAYMAFGKGSSNDYVNRLKEAFEDLRADGTLEAIYKKY
ncbi:transporter substrate-binding domain-containing protein [uncultured Desulfosarcina sp.]|uniref:substrate-binding periplasmic protein n=1 Tax=uncultured Desulfosarcina sp. TaxID=218289 RepID=UPI0029C604C8|nr:transporter substrate-binding domain-containing protein [uncultured Desulfosarcina sp.]